MGETATITFRRSTQWFGIIRRLKVLVDGVERAALRGGQVAQVEVLAGEHVVKTKMDWCFSNTMKIDCKPEEPVVVDCDSALLPLAALYVFVAPGKVFRVAEGDLPHENTG